MCFTGVWDQNKGLAMSVIWGLLSHLHWKMFCEDNRFQAAMSQQHLMGNSSQTSHQPDRHVIQLKTSTSSLSAFSSGPFHEKTLCKQILCHFIVPAVVCLDVCRVFLWCCTKGFSLYLVSFELWDLGGL